MLRPTPRTGGDCGGAAPAFIERGSSTSGGARTTRDCGGAAPAFIERRSAGRCLVLLGAIAGVPPPPSLSVHEALPEPGLVARDCGGAAPAFIERACTDPPASGFRRRLRGCRPRLH